MRSFKLLWGDVRPQDRGAKWFRFVGHSTERAHIIELINWHDAVGRDADAGPTYHASLAVVDLAEIPAPTQADALRSCGCGDLDEFDDQTERGLALIEACHAYGAHAPVWSSDGGNWRRLLAAAKRASRALDDPAAHAIAMARPVNAIGSSAREFMRGDLTSAIVRGVEGGDRSASLVARMYQTCSYRTLGGGLAIEDAARIEVALKWKG